MNGGGAKKKDMATQSQLKKRQQARKFIEDMENFINAVSMMTMDAK